MKEHIAKQLCWKSSLTLSLLLGATLLLDIFNRSFREKVHKHEQINPIRPGEGGEGVGAESARVLFSLRELPCYLSNTYEILPLLQKFHGEQNSELVAMATRFSTSCLVKSQEIVNFS